MTKPFALSSGKNHAGLIGGEPLEDEEDTEVDEPGTDDPVSGGE